jgi:hypothetical protein
MEVVRARPCHLNDAVVWLTEVIQYGYLKHSHHHLNQEMQGENDE